MHKRSFLQPILFGLLTIFFVASCDKGFNELGTDIVGDDHFGFDLDTLSTVKVYNQKLGAIASNNLEVNPLGFYTNPAFGTTEANFVTQVELSTLNPKFNNTDNTLYVQLPVVDSVIMDIPYFKKFVSKSDEVSTYTLDSIYGEKVGDNLSKFKLEVFESRYFLRDLDPTEALGVQQSYYTDEGSLIDFNKGALLNNAPETSPTPPNIEGTHNADGRENSHFYFDKREHRTIAYKADGITRVTPDPRSVPSMRLHMDKAFFDNLILNAPAGKLTDNATFKNYFRGLYFKVSHGTNPGNGNMAMLNFKGGKITIYYKEDKITPDNPATTSVNEYKLERPSKTYALNLKGNSISLLNNTLENSDYLAATSNSNEASRVYLKGGEGSMAIIDLFGTVDLHGYTLNPAFDINLPTSPTNLKYLVNNIPNGISDEIDNIKINGWLINEANLTFNIDTDKMRNANPDLNLQIFEPNRIYLYDLTNKKPIIDYTYDLTSNTVYPKFNKLVFGGTILDNKSLPIKQIRNADGQITNKGTKYKIRITNYVKNLIKNDSTNVRLGLSVTENINNIQFSKLRTTNTNIDRASTMSVMSPLGTILYGTNIPEAQTQEYKKRLKLEIYYTKP